MLLGFGISSPQHVAEAIAANAAGAITGSAITKIIDRHVSRETNAAGTINDANALHAELTEFIAGMKEATKK